LFTALESGCAIRFILLPHPAICVQKTPVHYGLSAANPFPIAHIET